MTMDRKVVSLNVIALTIFVFSSIVFSLPYKKDKIEDDLELHWKSFKEKFNKKYDIKEEELRFQIFKRNLERIKNHNRLDKPFLLDINVFADLESHEVPKSKHAFHKEVPTESIRQHLKSEEGHSIPDHEDWRTRGCVSPVKNQGQIGASLVFAIADGLESSSCSRWGKFKAVDDGFLARCCPTESLKIEEHLLACLGKLHGLPAAGYPKNGSCSLSDQDIAVYYHHYLPVRHDEDNLKLCVWEFGPTNVLIDAGLYSFQLYRSGIYQDAKCSQTKLDHAMLVIGYGVSNTGEDYWILKNSWGPLWGENGYMRLARNRQNMCGIAADPIYMAGSPTPTGQNL